jgi:hypothetical protein
MTGGKTGKLAFLSHPPHRGFLSRKKCVQNCAPPHRKIRFVLSENSNPNFSQPGGDLHERPVIAILHKSRGSYKVNT